MFSIIFRNEEYNKIWDLIISKDNEYIINTRGQSYSMVTGEKLCELPREHQEHIGYDKNKIHRISYPDQSTKKKN